MDEKSSSRGGRFAPADMTAERIFELFDEQPSAFVRLPVSTYRIQLDRHFTFAALRDLVPYLADLGITDCYLSPFLQPCSEQSHGYDIADHNRFNSVLGTEADYGALAEAVSARGMGLLIDVVPNHMGIAGSRNAWWLDVLENGPASSYAQYFDIDWDPVKPELKSKVLLPILGDQYGRILENQELVLEFQEGAFFVRYYENVLPVAPCTYTQILRQRLDELAEGLGKDYPHVLELQSIITALTHLPPRTETDPERLVERNREKQIIKRRLDALSRESPGIKALIQENVRIFNGIKGKPESFDQLDALLGAQAYRLAFWQVAGDETNYRRFFDINELAAIRMEEPQVFEEAHRLIFRLIRQGWVTGLRLDHVDGLFAPAQYFRSLQRRCFVAVAHRLAGHGGVEPDDEKKRAEERQWEAAVLSELDRRIARDPHSPLARAFYILVEKIRMRNESLPEGWRTYGTMGYGFLNALNGIFVSIAGDRALDETYTRFVGTRVAFRDVAYESKKLITQTSMSGEIAVLGHRLARISEKYRVSRDFTDKTLSDALREIIACFPVYRTYIGEDGFHVMERDRRYIEQAVATARRRNPAVSASVFDFIRNLFCLSFPEALSDADRLEHLTFVMKFQQLTGPVTAKGLEDTAFYRYNRLISLNEVGGSPDQFGMPVAEFHARNVVRQAHWSSSLSTTATHDSKRGEDVRARINVLSEIPQEWRFRLRKWHRLNKTKKATVHGQPTPDKNEEYLLYQTLIGAWPAEAGSSEERAAFSARIQQYLLKALREAKVHSSWINPDVEYEAAVQRFVTAVLDRSGENPFLQEFLPFQQKIAEWGMYNSLGQTLVKLAAPGVPDFYQGTELWDLNLVDPDNRRPVEYAKRRQLLADLTRDIEQADPHLVALARDLTSTKEDGRIKLYVTHRALTYRRQRPKLFLEGEYLPLDAYGPKQDHLCAFARRVGSETVVAAVPRLLARLNLEGPPVGKEVWADTWLALPKDAPGKRYRNVFTGEAVEVAEHDGRPVLAMEAVLSSFPVALLEQEG